MATNDFQPFAVGAGANVLSQADWLALAALAAGFSSGVAPSAACNKAWRQSSIMASVLGQFIANGSGNNSVDDGTTATLLANLSLAISNMGIGRVLRTSVYGRFPSTGGPGVSINGAAPSATGAGAFTSQASTRLHQIFVAGGGAGGGGAAATSSSQMAGGGGGSSGSIFQSIPVAGPFSAVPITIGAGGAGGVAGANNGSPGGTSSFGSLISCPGGAPGGAGVANAGGTNAGGAPSAPTGTLPAYLAYTGNPGCPGFSSFSANLAVGGGGGPSPFGAPAAWNSGGVSSPGQSANQWNAGGGGAAAVASTAAQAGGAGASGVIIIVEYA